MWGYPLKKRETPMSKTRFLDLDEIAVYDPNDEE
jgi:hypothetical protein